MSKVNQLPTATQVRKMKLAELLLLATELKIISITPDDKKWVVLETILLNLATNRNSQQVEISPEAQSVVDDKVSSKSEKIRSLWRLGLRTGLIATLTNAHPSFAYGVIERVEMAMKLQIATQQLENAVPPVVEQVIEMVTDVIVEQSSIVQPIIKTKKLKKTAIDKILDEVYA